MEVGGKAVKALADVLAGVRNRIHIVAFAVPCFEVFVVFQNKIRTIFGQIRSCTVFGTRSNLFTEC